MNSMHRQIGKIRNKGPGDAAKVSVLLNDYEDANKMLSMVGCLNDAAQWQAEWKDVHGSYANLQL